MRTIINYIRSCFCKHEWEQIFDVDVRNDYGSYRCKVFRCKKCGFSQRYKSNKG